jgi:hypothetical protein
LRGPRRAPVPGQVGGLSRFAPFRALGLLLIYVRARRRQRPSHRLPEAPCGPCTLVEVLRDDLAAVREVHDLVAVVVAVA